MVISEQVQIIANKVKLHKPVQAFKNISMLEEGARFVLRFLSESKKEVYASTISEKMHISRARVAVLLKKMEHKGLIRRNPSPNDARVEVIGITKKGWREIKCIQDAINKIILKVIEKIGFEQVNDFLDMSIRIKNIIEGEDNV